MYRTGLATRKFLEKHVPSSVSSKKMTKKPFTIHDQQQGNAQVGKKASRKACSEKKMPCKVLSEHSQQHEKKTENSIYRKGLTTGKCGAKNLQVMFSNKKILRKACTKQGQQQENGVEIVYRIRVETIKCREKSVPNMLIDKKKAEKNIYGTW